MFEAGRGGHGMNEPRSGGTARPNEEMIRDRLKNRRSLYELKRASGPSYQRWGRSFFEEPEDMSKAAPVWQRYPIYGFLAGTLSLAVILGAGAGLVLNWSSLTNDLDVGRYVAAIWSGDETDAAAVDPVALAIASASADRSGEDARDLPQEMSDRRSTLTAGRDSAKSGTPVQARSDSGAERANARESGEEPRRATASLPTPVEPLPESPNRIALNGIASDLAIDRDLLTGSVEPLSEQPSVPSLIERAHDIEARMGAVWPGFIEQAAAGIEALGDGAVPAESDVSRDGLSGMTVPVPDFKPDPESAPDIAPESGAAGAAVVSGEARPGSELPGIATSYVNMRNAPEMDADVLMVLSKGAALTVVACDVWCKVRYGATTGYVYETYVDTDPQTGVMAGEAGAGSL